MITVLIHIIRLSLQPRITLGKNMISAQEAIKRLKEGNKRFVSGSINADKQLSTSRQKKLITKQSPFAIILGCSDSRVPVEFIFDQGFGDLFVIRIAGNIVAASQVGSIEFAAECFKTKLVVVLGHSNCGAVTAAINTINNPEQNQSHNLKFIVDRIRLSIENLQEELESSDTEKFMEKVISANVRSSVNQLYHGSDNLKQLTKNKDLLVVGAKYSLDTGIVDFFDAITETKCT